MESRGQAGGPPGLEAEAWHRVSRAVWAVSRTVPGTWCHQHHDVILLCGLGQPILSGAQFLEKQGRLGFSPGPRAQLSHRTEPRP